MPRLCRKMLLALLAVTALTVAWGSENAYAAQGEWLSDLGEDMWLHTDGNRIRDARGVVWQGHGANLQDTRSCESCLVRPDVNEVLRRVDALTDDWHATFIRLTMENWWSSGVLHDPQYMADLRTIIDHIGQKKHVYVMLAMWHDPTLDANGWPTAAAAPIWERLVQTFGDRPYVMFGLSNEPEANADGALDAAAWQHMNSLVHVIRHSEQRHHFKRHIIAVQGTRLWARDVNYYVAHPITAGGGHDIAYETHIYNTAADFARLLEVPSQSLPMVVGEFGPAEPMTLTDCENLMQMCERLQIPYLGWTFHSSCHPNMLQNLSQHTCSRGEPIVPTAWGSLLQHHLSCVAATPKL